VAREIWIETEIGKEKSKMFKLTGKTEYGEVINFRFNEIRQIVKEADLVLLDRPREAFVKLSTVEVVK
jgi:hypothetical protein